MNLPPGFRTQPCNITAEQSILGAILYSNLAWHEVATLVREEDFFEPVHARIFGVMRGLIERGRLADPVTLQQAFDTDPSLRELDGADYLRRLAGMAATILDASAYARVVAELAGRRRLIERAEAIADRAADDQSTDSLAEQLADARAEIESLDRYAGEPLWRHMSEVLDGAISCIEGGREQCWSTGLPTLDANLAGGLRPGLYGIEARMKSFKSGFMGTIALHLIRQNVPLLFVALEMGSVRILERMVAHETTCNAVRFRKRENPPDLVNRLRVFRNHHHGAPSYFSDEPGLSFDKLRSILSQAVMKLGVKVIFVDYWQLVTGRHRGQNQAEFLAEIAQWLAAFAAREQIAIVMASQSNREGESYGSDGLPKACDWLAALHKCQAHTVSLGDHEELWLEIRANRDGMDGDIGSDENRPFRIDKRGPVVVDKWAQADVGRGAAA